MIYHRLKAIFTPKAQRMIVIIVAVSLIIGTLFYVEHPSVRALKEIAGTIGLFDSQYTIVGIADIKKSDHLLGDLDAEVVLLEYSDFTCVLCAAMQDNFQRVVREQKMLLVTRHLYTGVNSSGFKRAVAAECVAKHGGENLYRQYANYLYTNQRTIDDKEDLVRQAVALGIPSQKFISCVEDDTAVQEIVREASNEGFALGARGTPYIVVIHKGKPIGVSYANEYRAFLERVQLLLRQNT